MTQPMACARRRRQAWAVERPGSEEAAERPESRSLGLDATAARSGSSLGQKLVDEAYAAHETAVIVVRTGVAPIAVVPINALSIRNTWDSCSFSRGPLWGLLWPLWGLQAPAGPFPYNWSTSTTQQP